MRGLRAFTAALLLGGMSDARSLFQSLGQASDEAPPPKDAAPRNATVIRSLSPPCARPPLLAVALGVLAALFLHLC